MMQMLAVSKEAPPEELTVVVAVVGRGFVKVGDWGVAEEPEGAN
jgi:hypothetical protein